LEGKATSVSRDAWTCCRHEPLNLCAQVGVVLLAPQLELLQHKLRHLRGEPEDACGCTRRDRERRRARGPAYVATTAVFLRYYASR